MKKKNFKTKKASLCCKIARQNTLIPATTMEGDFARDPVHMLSSLAAHLQIPDLTEKKALEIYGESKLRNWIEERPFQL